MAEFNLVDEPWIKVIIDERGNVEEVSLRELFENAHDYRGLGGDTKTQDFAVLRFLLATLHTVFGRVNEAGEYHEEYFPNGFDEDKLVSDRFKPGEDECIDDKIGYEEELLETWESIWNQGQFPSAVEEYLDAWYDRFYLLGGEHPFYQVSYDFMFGVQPDLVDSKKKGGKIFGKAINRVLTESEHKIALFAPKTPEMKDRLSYAELARWLLTFHGYTGTADKQTFRKKTELDIWSKGWLYDIGGLYVVGSNLFETLMLNLVLVHPEEVYGDRPQRPLWESTDEEIYEKYMNQPEIDNLAELYSVWSRAIYIDPEQDFDKGFFCSPVKLQEVRHEDQFLEPMTLWRYREEGGKGFFLPRKHAVNQSLWRSFGLIAKVEKREDGENIKKPGVIDWLEVLRDPEHSVLTDDDITLCGVGMESDGNATSWTPVNEIYDGLNLDEEILLDHAQIIWRNRINSEIELTKYIIEKVYGSFLRNIEKIRFGEGKGNLVNHKKEQAYFAIDAPFREWLENIHEGDDMDKTCLAWRQTLKKIMIREGDKNLEEASTRDYNGVEGDGGWINLPMALNIYRARLNKELGQEARHE